MVAGILTVFLALAPLARAQAGPAFAQLQRAAASDGERWADGAPERPTLAAVPSGRPRAATAALAPAPPAPPPVLKDPFPKPEDGFLLGSGEGFLTVERPALKLLGGGTLSKAAGVLLGALLFVPALLFGLALGAYRSR